MPTHWVEKRRASQPNSPVPVDRSHWAGQRCKFAYVGPQTGSDWGIDLVSGLGPVDLLGTQSLEATNAGAGLRSTDRVRWENLNIGNLSTSGGVTIVYGCNRTTRASAPLFSLGDGGAADQFGVYDGGGGGHQCWANGLNNLIMDSPSNTILEDQYGTYAFTGIPSSNGEVYDTNGAPVSTTNNSWSTFLDRDIDALALCRDDAFSNNTTAVFSFLFVFDKPFSADQIQQLIDNPWQILEPERIPIFVPAAAPSASGKTYFVDIPWTTQPPSDWPVDLSNPLTRDLRTVWNPRDLGNVPSGYEDRNIALNHGIDNQANSAPIDHVRFNAAFNRSVHSSGMAGVRPNTVTTTEYIELNNNANNFDCNDQNFTLLSFNQFHAQTKDIAIFGIGGVSNFFVWSDHISGTMGLAQYDGSTSLAADNDCTDDAGRIYCIATTHDNTAGTLRSYVDGVEKIADVGSWVGTGTGDLQLNNWGGATDRVGDQTIYLFAYWDRVLSESEIRAISTNPWQLFKPQRIPVFVPAAAEERRTIWVPQNVGQLGAFRQEETTTRLERQSNVPDINSYTQTGWFKRVEAGTNTWRFLMIAEDTGGSFWVGLGWNTSNDFQLNTSSFDVSFTDEPAVGEWFFGFIQQDATDAYAGWGYQNVALEVITQADEVGTEDHYTWMSTSFNEFVDGFCSEPGLWNRPLSLAEIYKVRDEGPLAVPSGLVGYYELKGNLFNSAPSDATALVDDAAGSVAYGPGPDNIYRTELFPVFTPGAAVGASPQTIAMGLVTETDTSQAFTASFTVPMGLTTEADTAQPFTGSFVVPMGLATETDIAQPMGVSQATVVSMGLVTETDIAQPFTGSFTVPMGLPTETDTSLPMTADFALPMGLATETDTAQPMTVLQGTVVAMGLVTETDTAQSFTGSFTVPMGFPTEVDLAQAITPVQQAKSATVPTVIGGQNLSNLTYVVFDSYDVSVGTIIAQGTGESTDGSGELVIDLTATAVNDGDPVSIIITNYTTTPTAASRAAVCYTTATVT